MALLAGHLIRPLVCSEFPHFPALMPGFEAGMMGYAIFGAVYGAESIFKFGIIDLGQVTFVFFVLVSVLERRRAGTKPFSDTLRGFFTTPVILSILLGILTNRAGAMPPLNAWPVSAALLKTIEMVSGLTTLLIALIIGYEMRVEKSGLLKPLQSIGLRLLFWIPAGLLFNTKIKVVTDKYREYLFGSVCVYTIDVQRGRLPPVNLCAGRKRESGRGFAQSSEGI